MLFTVVKVVPELVDTRVREEECKPLSKIYKAVSDQSRIVLHERFVHHNGSLTKYTLLGGSKLIDRMKYKLQVYVLSRSWVN